MALNWKWEDKMGECTYTNGDKSTLYQGNAHMIAVYLLPDNAYQLAWYSIDKEHFRNMLGLSKGYEGVLDANRRWLDIETLKLNTAYKSVPNIVSDLAKAKVNIKIELYYEPQGK